MCVCDRVIVIVGFNELRGQWQEHSIHSCQVFFVSRDRERERESEIEQGTGTYIVVTDAKRQIDTIYDDKDKTKEDTYVDNARHILIQKKQR